MRERVAVRLQEADLLPTALNLGLTRVECRLEELKVVAALCKQHDDACAQ
jgi:hypothetical protein